MSVSVSVLLGSGEISAFFPFCLFVYLLACLLACLVRARACGGVWVCFGMTTADNIVS